MVLQVAGLETVQVALLPAMQVEVLPVVGGGPSPSLAASDGYPLGLLLLPLVLLAAVQVEVLAAVLVTVHVALLAAVQVAVLPVEGEAPALPLQPRMAKVPWLVFYTVGEDTGDVCMDVGVVTASEGRVVIGVLMMEVVDENVVDAGVSGDATGREVDEEEEWDTVEAVDVGVSAWGWCLCECL
ncbi:hypothetical protein NDU88_005531 [Pleurodeles waltl]|uniref:Uncharacterized protein n=1 Tax=Pleurodeles waltl TaxID=8319 RepID=A0AAV7PKM9_PLEWA|nr:hypothetical protein NDU88_005531 [Pleurodeles waltl]